MHGLHSFRMLGVLWEELAKPILGESCQASQSFNSILGLFRMPYLVKIDEMRAIYLTRRKMIKSETLYKFQTLTKIFKFN